MDLAGKKILVTGGAGFIGSHLLDVLAADNDVRVLDDFSTGRRENLAQHQSNRRVEVFEGDICKVADLRRAIDRVDVVFHLACRGVRHSIGHPQENHHVNATGTLNLLKAARSGGVARLVHVSSSEVYGTARQVPMDELHPCRPETVYGAAKLAGEAYARAYHQTYGVPTVVVRPFNNFGPRSHFEGDSGEVIPRFIVWALNGQPAVVFGDGRQTRDFIYVEETARWLKAIAECDRLVGRTINLGSGVETSVLELAEMIYREAGHPEVQPVFRQPRPGDVRRHLASAELARRELDFATRIDVAEGIRRLIAYFRELDASPAQLLGAMQQANWTLTDVPTPATDEAAK